MRQRNDANRNTAAAANATKVSKILGKQKRLQQRQQSRRQIMLLTVTNPRRLLLTRFFTVLVPMMTRTTLLLLRATPLLQPTTISTIMTLLPYRILQLPPSPLNSLPNQRSMRFSTIHPRTLSINSINAPYCVAVVDDVPKRIQTIVVFFSIIHPLLSTHLPGFSYRVIRQQVVAKSLGIMIVILPHKRDWEHSWRVPIMMDGFVFLKSIPCMQEMCSTRRNNNNNNV